jgi:DNA excision repair protein ERCC-3
MISFQGKRNPEVQTMIDQIKSIEWGLLIMDEVQVVPADMFRKTLTITKSHCKLGLTATLVREDEKIADLNFLIGPKHYEANWSDLQKDGYLARVQCIEIWTEMNSHFYEYYIKATVRKKMMLYFSNPNKLIICKSLIKHHKNDKIIIFCDDLFTLHKYAIELKVPFITGGVSHQEREKYIGEFRNTNKFNCLIMSKVGDTSIDIPNANVIIQISSHFGSRRQEAQRLGRILRPKPDSISEFNAYFYSIVSKNTEEMYFSNKRHKFLIDQGYCFKVVTSLADLNIKQIVSKDDDTLFLQMLDEIQYKNENEIEDESLSDNEYVDDNRSDLDYNENDLIEISEVDYNDDDNDYEMN